MSSYFIGGAAGTFVAIQVYNYGGWALSTTFMILLSMLAIVNVFRVKR